MIDDGGHDDHDDNDEICAATLVAKRRSLPSTLELQPSSTSPAAIAKSPANSHKHLVELAPARSPMHTHPHRKSTALLAPRFGRADGPHYKTNVYRAQGDC